ncbi:hypothetical protein, partial [Escherichia coli]|uniref:hypothetical protein n=1 Tax=Escherichia coli TaxID=562 RepID=UPI003F46B616
LDQYVGDAVKDLRQLQFDQQEQGDRKVLAYKDKFDELVQFVPQYHHMEEQKAKRFLRGLRPDIRKALRPFWITNYHEMTQNA